MTPAEALTAARDLIRPPGAWRIGPGVAMDDGGAFLPWPSSRATRWSALGALHKAICGRGDGVHCWPECGPLLTACEGLLDAATVRMAPDLASFLALNDHGSHQRVLAVYAVAISAARKVATNG